MTTTIGGFTITARAGGAAVQVSIADLPFLPRFKQTFPRARFSAATRSWHVPGRLAVDRVVRLAEAVAQEQSAVRARIDRILRDAEFDGHAIALDTPGLDGHQYLTALAHNGQQLSTRHVHVIVCGDEAMVHFAYDDAAVALMRTIPGAHFVPDAKAWSIPLAKVRDLHGVIGRMEESLATAREWNSEAGACEATAQARRATRILMLLALRPAVGAMVRLHAKARVIEGYGRSFRLDERTANVWGPHYQGQEGQLCCYAYTRPATPRETMVLKGTRSAFVARRPPVRPGSLPPTKTKVVPRSL